MHCISARGQDPFVIKPNNWILYTTDGCQTRMSDLPETFLNSMNSKNPINSMNPLNLINSVDFS